MARPGITYQEVAAACDQIVATSENPTIKRVTEVLGTGSPNTVLRHLNTWRDAAPVAVRKVPELPIELQTAIIKEITRQKAESRDEIEKQLTQSQSEAKELSTVGEALEDHIDHLQSENQGLSNEAQQLLALAEERKQEITKLTIELKQERDRSEDVRLKLAQELNKADLLINHTNALESDVIMLKNDLKQSESEKYKVEKNLAVVEAKIDAEKEKTQDVKDHLKQKEVNFSKEKLIHENLLKTKEVYFHEETKNKVKSLEEKITNILSVSQEREDELNKKIQDLMLELTSCQTVAAEMKGRLIELDQKKTKDLIK